jgi:hypothetical protein
MTDVTLAIAWYTPESLEQLRAVAEHKVGTYEEVSDLTEKAIADFARRGIKVEKVLIDIPALVHWCRSNGHLVNSRAISIYASTGMCVQEMPTRGSA